MTSYTVVWVQSAQDELAQLWLNSRNRNAVTTATDDIDQELAVDASMRGTELREGLRALSAPPLKVIFCVREDDRIVEVLMVQRI